MSSLIATLEVSPKLVAVCLKAGCGFSSEFNCIALPVITKLSLRGGNLLLLFFSVSYFYFFRLSVLPRYPRGDACSSVSALWPTSPSTSSLVSTLRLLWSGRLPPS